MLNSNHVDLEFQSTYSSFLVPPLPIHLTYTSFSLIYTHNERQKTLNLQNQEILWLLERKILLLSPELLCLNSYWIGKIHSLLSWLPTRTFEVM